MGKIKLFEWSATHTIGYVWIRRLYIRKTKVGTYSITAHEQNFDGPSLKVPGEFHLRTAREVLCGIFEMAMAINPEDFMQPIIDASDLKKAATMIGEFDPGMAKELEQEIAKLSEDPDDCLQSIYESRSTTYQ